MIFILRKQYLVLAAIILALSVLTLTGRQSAQPTASSEERLLPIYSVEREDKVISLTFDAAWEDGDTDRLLEIFDRYGCKVSIFGVGEWVERCSASVKKFSDAGHEILNHSDSHLHVNRADEETIRKDLEACEERILRITGKEHPKLYRGPYGEYNNTVITAARKEGYQVVQWDVDSLDYQGLTADRIADRILKKVRNGSILLFHTGVANTPDALELLLPKLQNEGYRFLPVSQLLYRDSYTIDHTGRQIPDKGE